MATRFNPAPGWPRPPDGWHPPPGWKPDPSWPEPPPGWPLWIAEDTSPEPRPRRSWALLGGIATALGLLIALVAWLYPDLNDPDAPSSAQERAPYLAAANKLCQDVQVELSTVTPPAPDDPDARQHVAVELSRIHRDLFARWSELSPPVPGDRPAIQSMLDALEELSISYGDLADTFEIQNPELFQTRLSQVAVEVRQAGEELRSSTRAYGVHDCTFLGR